MNLPQIQNSNTLPMVIAVGGISVAVGIGAALLSAQGELLVAVGLGATAGIVPLLVAFRRSAIGRDIRLLRYLGTAVLGTGVLLITFNGLRVGTHLTASDVLLLGAGVIFVLSVSGDESIIPRLPGWLAVGAVGLLVAGFLSTWTSSDVSGDLLATGEFAIALLGVPMLLAFGTGAPARLLFISKVWLLSAALNSGIALTDFTHLTNIGPAIVGATYVGRPTGLSVHPNHLGMAAAMAIPIGLFFGIRARKPLVSGVYLSIVAITGLGVLISGSRAALLVGISGALLLPALGKRLWKPVMLIGVAAAAILLITSLVLTSDQLASATNPFSAIQRLTDPATAPSDAGRIEYYGAALTDFAKHPFTGVGFDVIRNAHDIYFQLLEGGGLLAIMAFLTFGAGSLRLGLRLTRDPALGRDMQNLASGLTASLLVWLLAGLVQNLIYDRFLYLPVGLLIGLKLASAARLDPQGGRLTGAPRRYEDIHTEAQATGLGSARGRATVR